ncbi:MAG: MltA domain-containing protein [Casimicrobiaceae bacterium]
MPIPLLRASRGALHAALLFLAALAGGCQTAPGIDPSARRPPAAIQDGQRTAARDPAPRALFAPVTWTDLPGWNTDALEAAWPALRIGCRALLTERERIKVWQAPCMATEAVNASERSAVRAFFEQHFSPYRISDADGHATGLVTAYFEPVLAGSRVRSATFNVPLYAPPDDLLTVDLAELHPELKDKRVRGRVEGTKVVPYWPRRDIERGAAPLAGKALVYVSDPVEAFFLEIQGSGRVSLAGESVIRLNYADQNGHPYRSIGRVLIDGGELPRERASLQGIIGWAKTNPERLRALLDENPSYVFFREVPPPAPGSLEALIDGPIGTLGVPVLAGRTIAIDRSVIPLGAPIFLATTMPLSNTPLQRLVLAQDTGGAIRGAVRADFFWGTGAQAGREAGRMRQEGRMWLLWPKHAPLPVQ